MSLTLIIFIIIVGLLLLALEIVALPGGIAGIFGGGFVAVGVWQAYVSQGAATGNTLLLSSFGVGAIMIFCLIKTKAWRKASLDEAVEAKTNTVTVQPGDEGITIARLAPAGKAIINGQQVEVHALNAFLDPQTPVRVVEVDGYRVVVEKSA